MLATGTPGMGVGSLGQGLPWHLCLDPQIPAAALGRGEPGFPGGGEETKIVKVRSLKGKGAKRGGTTQLHVCVAEDSGDKETQTDLLSCLARAQTNHHSLFICNSYLTGRLIFYLAPLPGTRGLGVLAPRLCRELDEDRGPAQA